jgi:hypothetical protein
LNAVKTVHRQLEASGLRPRFDAAIDALAGELDTDATRTDYGRRRYALRAWAISPRRWCQLITGLPASCHELTDWGDGKRLLASVWVWSRITGGEHLFAPAMRPDISAPRNQRPGGPDLVLYVNVRWPGIARGTKGHYIPLRQRLDAYADQLAASIDSNPAGAIS